MERRERASDGRQGVGDVVERRCAVQRRTRFSDEHDHRVRHLGVERSNAHRRRLRPVESAARGMSSTSAIVGYGGVERHPRRRKTRHGNPQGEK